MPYHSPAVCIHAHFYQPARDDPLTGEIPWEEGSHPYPNWNEKIFEECYKPNAELGNFGRISFNLGPTLTDWMARYHPEVLSLIVAQEKANYQKNGVGNGMAQAYHHTILPLDLPQDRETQVCWGIEDFKYRFGHMPAGMWLPETAADTETLHLLAKMGIQFTILAPWQAKTAINPNQPAKVVFPDGLSLAVFFYDRSLSTAISFNPMATENADQFTRNYMVGYGSQGMVMAASDGELYGHHQPFRDKFLEYLTHQTLPAAGYQVSYPGLYLLNTPPKQVVEIEDGTSWSCHHGVQRWQAACGCTPHGEWKAYLREAFGFLTEQIDEEYMAEMVRYTDQPWEVRHRYIDVLHGKLSFEALCGELFRISPTPDQMQRAQHLLRAQVERLRMFTSCGWFHDDFDRINPRNNVAYAAQAVIEHYEATGVDLTEKVLPLLSKVISWRTGLRADVVFQSHVERARIVQ